MNKEEQLELLRNKVAEERDLMYSIENEMEELEERIDSLRDERESYQNEYDYESDPDGNDYDLSYIADIDSQIEDLMGEMDSCQMRLNRCEYEIECYSDEYDGLIGFTGTLEEYLNNQNK
jgi:peptidoglycan hydrolase CwlO-like protein